MEINDVYDLSNKIGIKWNIFKYIINDVNNEYRETFMTNKNGTKRILHIPSERLAYCQEFILREILDSEDIHNCAHGFIRQRNIFTNAEVHKDQVACINMDIKNFFGSINRKQVYTIFSKVFKFNSEVSIILTKLCSFENELAQGACTSPTLANIASRMLDNRIQLYCDKYNFKYTRYADDITISSSENFEFRKVIYYIGTIFNQCGFEEKYEKTKIYKAGDNIMITGLVIVSGKVKIPRKYIRKIRQELYYLNKYGVIDHMEKCKIKNMFYQEHLEGKINYIGLVDKQTHYILSKEFKKIEWPDGYDRSNIKLWKLMK